MRLNLRNPLVILYLVKSEIFLSNIITECISVASKNQIKSPIVLRNTNMPLWAL